MVIVPTPRVPSAETPMIAFDEEAIVVAVNDAVRTVPVDPVPLPAESFASVIRPEPVIVAVIAWLTSAAPVASLTSIAIVAPDVAVQDRATPAVLGMRIAVVSTVDGRAFPVPMKAVESEADTAAAAPYSTVTEPTDV